MDKSRAPGPQLKIEAMVAEPHQPDPGGRVLQNIGIFDSSFDEQSLNQLDIGPVSHRYRYPEPDLPVVMAPVDDILGDEPGIGHDDGNVVVGHHRRAPGADAYHIPFHVPHHDPVPHLDRSLEKDDEPADEIVDDVL